MNCLDRITIQEYIDKELDAAQIRKIEAHLQECDNCKEIYEEAIGDKAKVNEFLSQLNGNEESIAIPEYDINIVRNKTFLNKKTTSRLILVAASIALLIGLFFILRTNLSSPNLAFEDADLLLLEMIGDTEPNKSWHNSQMVIVITNEEGEVIQSFISTEE